VNLVYLPARSLTICGLSAILQVEYLSFDNQISYFEQTKNKMISKIGKKAAEEVVNGAIFQIGLGTVAIFFSPADRPVER
jgi:hypothetical protein